MPINGDSPPPDFLILGAQKCATTWLAHTLARQTGVFLPPKKELHYFTRHFERGPQWYCDQFAAGLATGAHALGEATPNYLAVNLPEYGNTAERIAAYRPSMKFVVIVRHPVDRLISAYMHHVVRGRFDPLHSFDVHISDVLSGRQPGYGIVEFGEYGQQLEVYLRLFGRDQFLIYIYEEMKLRNPADVVCEILSFLGLGTPAPVGPVDVPRNVSIRGRRAARFGGAISTWMRDDETRMRYGGTAASLARLFDAVAGGPRLMLTPELRGLLVEHYREDVATLASILGRSKSPWQEFARTPAAGFVEGQLESGVVNRPGFTGE